MNNKNTILERVETFRRNKDTLKKTYNEEMLRVEFVNPFFEALGWDVTNKAGNAEAYKDVIHEDAIKIGSATKAPDYAFRVGGIKKFFVEAKKPAVNIKEDIHPAFQLRRYAWSAKLPLSILTDFEEFAVYDCRIRPFKTDKASTGRIMFYTFEDYIEKWDEISGIFSKDAIYKGSFDKYVESSKKKRGTAEVDDVFLKEIETWRDLLARNIALRNTALTQRELNFAVARTIDRIIFLRIAEDRGMEDYGQLQALQNSENIYERLVALYKRADDKYNSGLFHFCQEKDRPGAADELTTKLIIDDKVIKDIVKNLYYPDSSYEFSVLPADILGYIYEQFLGKVIRLTAGHHAKIEEKPEVRKAGGVYYTPTYIVDYIVKNTVGELVKGKTPQQVAKLRILDPACGSGSFLIGAFQYLLDWHRDWYGTNEPEKYSKGKNPAIFKAGINDWRLTTTKRKEILLNNIYGVDIDPQAVEVSKLSLLLKVLEGESKETLNQQRKLFQERALPDLGNNIKCGNSLIGPDFYDNQQISLLDDEERCRINVFDWETEFPQIFEKGGFDAVIGNPPWGAHIEDKEKSFISRKFRSFKGNYDSYIFFIEKAESLIKHYGILSFITPDTWTKIPQAIELRKTITKRGSLKAVTILPTKVFKKVSANCIVFTFVKSKRHNKCRINILFPSSNLSLIAKGKFDDSYMINTSNWQKRDDFQFQIYQKEEITKIVYKIQNHCAEVYKHLDVMQGIVPYSKENHSVDIIKSRLFHAKKRLSTDYGPWIRGRAITRYNISTNYSEYLKYGKWLHRPRKSKYFKEPRILIQEITGGNPPRISACYFSSILYHDPGIISCLNISKYNVLFILGIINSKFLSWYHQYSSPKGTRISFPKVLIGDIRKFPIPKINIEDKKEKAQHDKMVSLVDRMLELNKQLPKTKTDHDRTSLLRQIDAADKQIDKLVYKLYDLTDEEINIVEGK